MCVYTRASSTAPAPGAEREPVFALRVHGYSVEEAAVLLENEADLRQRSGLHCAPGIHHAMGTFPEGTLRLSFGARGTEEEVDIALDSLRMLGFESKEDE